MNLFAKIVQMDEFLEIKNIIPTKFLNKEGTLNQ